MITNLKSKLRAMSSNSRSVNPASPETSCRERNAAPDKLENSEPHAKPAGLSESAEANEESAAEKAASNAESIDAMKSIRNDGKLNAADKNSFIHSQAKGEMPGETANRIPSKTNNKILNEAPNEASNETPNEIPSEILFYTGTRFSCLGYDSCCQPEAGNPKDCKARISSPSTDGNTGGSGTAEYSDLIESVFGGSIIQNQYGKFIRKRTVYGFDQSYGKISLSGLLTTSFEDTRWWTRMDQDLLSEDIVFLDTETTGLAGGTGTVAFLVGLGYISEDGLVVDQYLMRDFDEEYPLLQDMMDLLKRFKVLVTFNGKSFDWPLLESRLIYSRMRPISWEDSHLDLLHTARRLWGNRLENCSLTSLEKNILGRRRIDDIPGSQIPGIYLDYLQTRKSDEMKRVIQHNEWDIAAMAALLVHTAGLYSDPQNKGDCYELFGIARELERDHRIREAAVCYKACIRSAAHHSLILDAKKRFAYLTKRHKGPQEAMDLWAELAGEEGGLLVFPLIEMAKFLEHKEKDYQKALDCTEKAIIMVNKVRSTGSQRLKEELINRKERLMKKIERSMELWG